MSKQIREFANMIDDIFPNCKPPLNLPPDILEKQIESRVIKGKLKQVIKHDDINLHPNDQANQPIYQILTYEDTSKSNLEACDIVFMGCKIKTNKLNDIIGTRVGNMQGYIKQIINNLAQLQ